MAQKIFPWFNQPEELDKRQFDARQVPNTLYTLITPRKSKFKWAPDELPWRTTLLGPNGEEISGGMPKFKNYGEDRDEKGAYSEVDQAINRAIEQHVAIITRKEDGSLIIRSVYQDKVILRTRGSHQLPSFQSSTSNMTVDFEKEVNDVVAVKYPLIADPNFYPDLELYFEFVSPTNIIVVPYKEADIIFIHAKERRTHRMLSWEELGQIAQEGGFNLVKIIDDLNHAQSLQELKDIIDRLEKEGQWGEEGVVVRDPQTGLMAKVKGADYLLRHRAKSSFDFESMIDIAETSDVHSFDDLKQVLYDLGIDWEIVSQVEEWYRIYAERKRYATAEWNNMVQFVDQWKKDNYNDDARLMKKNFAMAIMSNPNKSWMFGIYGGDARTHDKWMRFVLYADI